MIKWLKVLIIAVSAPVGLVCLLLLLATLADYRPDKPENAEMKGKAPDIQVIDSGFTLLSWNIGYFGLGKDCDFFYDGGIMTRPSRVEYLQYSGKALEYLSQTEKIDFLFFQEVDLKSKRSYFDDQVFRLRQTFPKMESAIVLNYLVRFVPVPLRNPMGRVKSGLVSFSAWHTLEITRYPFPGGYSWPVRLFQLDRCFLLTRLALPGGKELVLINTHNEAFDDGSQRKQQIAVLRDLMLAEFNKGNYVITGGDWNMNPPMAELPSNFSSGDNELPLIFRSGDISRSIEPKIEKDFFPKGWNWVFDPGIPSNRNVDEPYTKGKTPTTIIDFFVVSPNISVEKISTEDLGFEWSDHQPVIMRFKIR
jgi:endonuclease/exonuclease/phosphatase family metal-dependent hydrolase